MDDAPAAGGLGARGAASAGPTAVRSAAVGHRAAEATVTLQTEGQTDQVSCEHDTLRPWGKSREER